MGSFQDFNSAHLTSSVAFMGENVTFQSSTFKAVVARGEVTEAFLPGGAEDRERYVVEFPKTSVASMPARGDSATVRSKAVKVDSCEVDGIAYRVAVSVWE